jgi:hypothetical protein
MRALGRTRAATDATAAALAELEQVARSNPSPWVTRRRDHARIELAMLR